jgi:hypothetical protein
LIEHGTLFLPKEGFGVVGSLSINEKQLVCRNRRYLAHPLPNVLEEKKSGGRRTIFGPVIPIYSLLPQGCSPGGPTMYHTIEFGDEFLVDLEISPKHHLEKVILPKGSRLRAEIKPYVVETEYGLVEVADLFLEDGTAARGVRFDTFAFIDN